MNDRGHSTPSDRESAGSALSRHELAEFLAEQAHDALIATSPQGSVIYWSRGARRLFGRGAEDAVGRPFVEVAISPEERERAIRAIAEALTSGEGAFRTMSVRDDGSRAQVGIELICVRDAGGAPRFVAITAKDLVDEARLHAAEAAEARFRGLLEAAPDAMVIVRGDRTIALTNAQVERMFGYRREELLGERIEILVPERCREGHVAHRDRFYDEPRTRPMGAGLDLLARRKDGTEFPVEISLSPMRTEEGMFVTAAIRDITERKQAEAERRRAEEAVRNLNKELEAFSYSVSHDLRAPLRAMDGFSQVLLEDFGEQLDPKAREHLGRIQQASRRMAQLIDDLLALSRLTRSELRHEQVDLSGIARSVVADLTTREPGRRIAWQIAPEMGARGDPRLLQIAISNLLENAWKFTRHKPEAVIGFGEREENGEHVYYVRDDGVGFDMAYASKLFSPFQRLHSHTQFEGTGIGLVTVQRIVHRHGGRIWADSAVDRGATFSFTLGGEGAS